MCTSGIRSNLGQVGFCWLESSWGADDYFDLVWMSDTEITPDQKWIPGQGEIQEHNLISIEGNNLIGALN